MYKNANVNIIVLLSLNLPVLTLLNDTLKTNNVTYVLARKLQAYS